MRKFSVFLFFISSVVSAQNISFDAKGILFLSDADLPAFSFDNGPLYREKGSTDKFGGILFPLKYSSPSPISEEVISNSSVTNYKSIATSRDNRTAYVLESKGPLEPGSEQQRKNLPDGHYVSVVDISNLQKLKPEYRFPVGVNPKAIELDKKNEYLAICTEEYDKEIQVFELNEFGKPIRIIGKPNLLPAGKITDVCWHPGGDFLAYINQETHEIGLIKVLRDGPTQKIIRLEQYGTPLKIAGLPTHGKFTPDGKYFLVLDKKKEAENSSGAEKGEIFVIKFNLEDASSHFLLSKAEVEENPSSFVIHPQGNWIIVSNHKRSFEDPEKSSLTAQSSLSVLSFSVNGTIQNTGNVNIEGILPFSLGFDKTGQNIALGIFQYLSFGHTFGGIEFYKFTPERTTKLEKQKAKIATSKGIHAIKVIEDY